MNDRISRQNSMKNQIKHSSSSLNNERQWHHLDAFASIDHLSQHPDSTNIQYATTSSILWSMLDIPSLLVIIGVCAALLSYALSVLTTIGNNYRISLIGESNNIISLMIYILWCIINTFISCFITQYLCPEAAGGGVPEMKTILSGTVKPILLSFKLIITKSIGLSLALIGGDYKLEV